MTIGQRIRKRREELNWSQGKLALKMHYKSRSSINKIESGDLDITQTKIMEFARVLQMSPSQLMGWSGEEVIPPYSLPVTPYYYTPLSGTGEFSTSETSTGANMYLPEGLLPDTKEDYFYIQVTDNAMNGAGIKSGDIAIFQTARHLKNGSIGYFRQDGKLLCRGYFKEKERKQVTLSAYDQEYPPLVLDEEPIILGQLIYVLSKR